MQRRFPLIAAASVLAVVGVGGSLSAPCLMVRPASRRPTDAREPIRSKLTRAGASTDNRPCVDHPSQRRQLMAWSLHGTYFETCSCDVVCPCTASLSLGADYDRCRGTLVFHIVEGNGEGT